MGAMGIEEDCLIELSDGWAFEVVASDRERGMPVAGSNISRVDGDAGHDDDDDAPVGVTTAQ